VQLAERVVDDAEQRIPMVKLLQQHRRYRSHAGRASHQPLPHERHVERRRLLRLQVSQDRADVLITRRAQAGHARRAWLQLYEVRDDLLRRSGEVAAALVARTSTALERSERVHGRRARVAWRGAGWAVGRT
jgi:hypothetical protein